MTKLNPKKEASAKKEFYRWLNLGGLIPTWCPIHPSEKNNPLRVQFSWKILMDELNDSVQGWKYRHKPKSKIQPI